MIINKDILYISKHAIVKKGKNPLLAYYKPIKDAIDGANVDKTRTSSFGSIEIAYYEKHSEYCANYDIFLVELPSHYCLDVNPISIFFEIIPYDIVNKIKNKEILLGLYSPYEPLSSNGFFDNIYEKMIIQYGIPESQILFITGSYDHKDYILDLSKKLNKQPIKLEYYSRFALLPKIDLSRYDPKFTITSSLTKKSTKKKFIFLNRTNRSHRVGLLCLLNNKNLLKDSYTSFLQSSPQVWDEMLDSAKQSFLNIQDKLDTDIKDQLPLCLDVDMMVDVSSATSATFPLSPFLLKYYYQTYFSLVSETVYGGSYPRFLTEKTFKCITYKHPFILASCPNSLVMLKFLGFKTFHPLINEDYDSELDEGKRLLMITEEVERLCNLSESELKSFKEQALEIVEYNYNHLMTTVKLLYKLL